MTEPFLPLEQPYIYGDVEAAAIRWLKTRPEIQAAGISLGTSTPADLDQRLPFVTLERIPGGARGKVTDDARIDVESRASSREESHDVIQIVLGLLEIMYQYSHEGMIIYRADIESSPGWLPDPVTNQPRWIATVSIRNRPK